MHLKAWSSTRRICREFKVLTLVVDERVPCVCSVGRLDLAHKDRMFPAIMHRGDPAVEVAEAIVEDGCAADHVMISKTMKPIDNPGLPAAEAIGQFALVLVEQIDGK